MYSEHSIDQLTQIVDGLFTGQKLRTSLSLITNHLTDVTGAERCSIFIYNENDRSLITMLATGIEKIEVSTGKGIVGYVFRSKDSIIENDVVNNPYFLGDIDKQSGYTTDNIAACPIYDSRKKCIGVLELLNKPNGFEESELTFIKVFSNYIGSVLELAPFYLNR